MLMEVSSDLLEEHSVTDVRDIKTVFSTLLFFVLDC